MNFREEETTQNDNYDVPWKVSHSNLEMYDNTGSVRPKNPFSPSNCTNYQSMAEPSTLGEFRLPAARMSYVDIVDTGEEEDSDFMFSNAITTSCNANGASPVESLSLEKLNLPDVKESPVEDTTDEENANCEEPAESPSVEEVNVSTDEPNPVLELYDVANENSSYPTFLHNLVATHQAGCTSENYMKAIEHYLEESDEHELNEQDSQGRTALHVAVQYSNVEGIAALLMSGADVNVADLRGKSPFTYCLDNYDMRNYKCNQMFYTFLGHVHKLIVIGLRVSPENRQCYAKARSRHVFNDKQLQLSYANELDKMEDVRVSWCTSLRDVLYQGADEIATSVLKRRTLEEILTTSDFYKEFPKLCCLLKLQYRRGITRRKLMQPVKLALEKLAGQGLPDPCSEAIIRQLQDDDDLMNLMRLGLEIRAAAGS